MPGENPFETNYREYDAWFDANVNVFASELLAVRELLPKPGRWVEVGVGSGRFASALGIRVGIEPAEGIASLALERGIEVLKGTAENLPLEDASADALFLITTLCFVRDVERAFAEAFRVLAPGGVILVAFIPSDSPFGELYARTAERNPFLRDATLRSREAIVRTLTGAGFRIDRATHTLTVSPERANDRIDPPGEGWERGSFVVLRGGKAASGGPPSESAAGEPSGGS